MIGGIETLGIDMSVADEENKSTVPRKSITTPGSTTVFLGPRDNGSLDKLRKGLDTPEPTPSATASGKSRPTYARRVASDGVPPRPLSERPMIYSSTRPSLQKPHGSVSTPNVRSVLPLLRNSAPGQRYSPIRTNSVEKIGRRRPRRPPSVDSLTDGSVENTDSEDKASRNGGSSARNTRDPQNTMKDSHTMGPDAARVPEKSMCYFCKEYCQAGDNLCSKCQTRFQPQEEVFDYSESEYEDDLEWEDQSCFSPDTEQPPATPSRLSKRRNTRYSRLREKSRGWSELSSMSQLQQLASRSASTSPTSHIALELKVVPPQDIKIRTVSSPTRANAGDRRSALHHIQQAMKPRGSINHGCQDRDAIRLGRVRSGEIRRVDYPDIVKAKPPTPKESEFPRDSQEHQQQSQGSTGNWLKCYDEDDKNSERHSDSARSDCLELLPDREHSAVPAPPGTYDRVTSIYDLYASFEDT